MRELATRLRPSGRFEEGEESPGRRVEMSTMGGSLAPALSSSSSSGLMGVTLTFTVGLVVGSEESLYGDVRTRCKQPAACA
jgi:hypothetical protein